MEIKDLSTTDVYDIFGSGTKLPDTPAFKGGLDNTVDILGGEKEEKPEEEVAPPDVQEEKIEEGKEVDILGGTPEAEPKVDSKGLTEYYQERLNNGQFVSIETEDENGKKTQFIPRTPEEFDEVLELQLNYKLEQAEKDLERKWYDSKSPAWKAVSQYAEMVDDPTQLIPFLQGVRNIQSVQSLNEETPEDAEQIIRIRMESKGDPESLIKTQIESLKTTDTLLSTAKQVKPLMVQEEQQQLALQVQRARQEEQEYIQTISRIREGSHKAIEQPIFGKQKLQQSDKALIWDMIAVPSEEYQGYKLYTEIDKLFEKGDFETLKQVALLVGKKDAFFSYLGTDIGNQVNAKIQKKLIVAGEMRGGSKDQEISDRPTVQRNQFNKTPRFGK